jgi:dephospho-CoA kinase
VSSSFNEWCSERNDHSLVVIDAAVLIEAGFHRIVDKVITVTAPQAMRIERVMKRDQSARHEVEVRMRHQLSDEEKIKQSDFVIYNDNRQSLIAQVDALLLSGAFNSQYQ